MTYIGLLRAINLAGHRSVAMVDLRACCEALGMQDVKTLLQSGNLLFRAGRSTPVRLERELEAAARTQLGLPIEFFVRTADEWDAIVKANPFPKAARDDPGRLLLMSLKAAPDAAKAKALRQAIVGREQVHVDGRHAYFIYPDGAGRSKLTNAVIERHLATRGTARNWNTVLKLHAAAAQL